MKNWKSFLAKVIEGIQTLYVSRRSDSYSRKRSLQMETLEPREMLSGIGFHSSEDAIEGISSGLFRVERTDTEGELTVDFKIETTIANIDQALVAINGIDLQALPGTGEDDLIGSITFANGEKFAEIQITPINNSLPEPTKQLRISLVQPEGSFPAYTVDTNNASSTLNIIDDDTVPQIAVAEVIDAHEGGESGKFVLTRDNTAHELKVSFRVYSNSALQGDYSILGVSDVRWQQFPDSITGAYRYAYVGSITFEVGRDTAEIVVSANYDTTVELNETVELSLTDAYTANESSQYQLSESTRSAIMQIIDDEVSAEVAISEVINAYEGGESGKFVLTRNDTVHSLTVGFRMYSNSALQNDYSISGASDVRWQQFPDSITGAYRYAYVGSITFEAGRDTAEIIVVANNDSTVELNEILELFL